MLSLSSSSSFLTPSLIFFQLKERESFPSKMHLRSREIISNPTANGEHSDGSESSDKADSDFQLSDLSDHEIHLLSSDSDLNNSTDKGEMHKERDFLGINHKPEAKINATCSECAEPSYKMGVANRNLNQGQDGRESADQDYDDYPEFRHPHEYPRPIRRKYGGRKKRKRTRTGPLLKWESLEESHEKWIDQNFTVDIDLDQQNAVITETAEPPLELIMPLLRYQKEWLAWALKQEESEVKGGILADEMGMGKTIQAIALVLSKRELIHATGECDGPSLTPSSSKDFPAVKANLVICPVVAVSQWASEIDRFTLKGSTKVLVYHGAKRGKSIEQFLDYDFVITTYSVVESEYRKYMMPPKEECKYCGKLFQPSKLRVHLKYFCGPYAVKTAKQSKQERKKKSMSNVRKVVRKKKSELNMEKKDMGSDFEMEDSARVEPRSPQGKSVLHSVRWTRIILDEAHFVKDKRCNTAKAVMSLESSYKWALSGTPLQNRIGELYSLVRFLQVVPYSYYFCRDCDCRILDYSSSNQCSNCEHASVRHFCWWNKYVATPIQHHGTAVNSGKRAMILLKNKVLKDILLRRTKKGRAADLALPPRIVSLRRDSLDIKEADYYESLYNESQAQFNTYVQAGTVLNNYAHIFDLLTRLRQAVDHPYLVVYSSSTVQRSGSLVIDADKDNVEQECGICHESAEEPVVTSCGHVFCKACLLDYSMSVGEVKCPSCSRALTVDLTTKADAGGQTSKTTVKGFKSSSIINRLHLNDFQTSTKIEALREEIRFMVERDGSAKGIVFSQFTSFLDLIKYSLQKSGVKCVQLEGSMSLPARDAAIKTFIEDPDCRIFLMSLKAGGVALNLTVASHVFLMDPWWNPAVERQAQDRIHRIGQYKPIRIVRFIIENTIEERILKLQEKKELMFEGTIGGSSEALGKLTEADMRFLFTN